MLMYYLFGKLADYRSDMIFQQDGAHLHYETPVRQHSLQELPSRWIERGGPIPWPARSPSWTTVTYFSGDT